MNWYERLVVPRVIDCACGLKPIRMQREKVVPGASGRVLEVGMGSGLNMPHYHGPQVEKIWGLDPALDVNPKAAQRIAAAGLEVELLPLSAEKIPAADDSFDTVLLTYTLCSIEQPLAALAEMRRVLKPEGRLLFCEHGRAPDAGVARWQRRINPLWSRLAGNCHLDRDVPGLLAESGFAVSKLEQMYIPGPKPWCYNYWGEASG